MSRRISNTILAFSALTCVVSSACLATPDNHESIGDGEQAMFRPPPPPPCAIPAHTAPTYTRPADDTIAFGTLIDGAGYAYEGNSNWADIASGNVCGGAEKELVLVKNAHSFFSIMHGPVPYPVSTFDGMSSTAHPWRAVATLDVDMAKDGLDEIVALRHVTATGVPDLVVMKMGAGCNGAVWDIESRSIGNPGNSDWVDMAVGDFDGTGKQIALLKGAHSNFFLVRPNGLTISFISDLDTAAGMPWKRVAAGDLDGDGRDELVVARQVSDTKSATVLVYKWSAGDFHLYATSTFGNNGNSNWTGMTVGDFNGDGHRVIALQKNEHSNFALLDLVKNTLRELATSDLDSVTGQPWRGITAVDWAGGDQGAQELVAVRAAHGSYIADLFVYGNPFQRALRDSAMAKVKGQWDQHDFTDTQHGVANDWISSILDTHTNLFNMTLERVGDYDQLVAMLARTHTMCVDGKQVRIGVTIPPAGDMKIDANNPANSLCAFPTDSPITPFNELGEYFTNDTTDLARCRDMKEWSRLLGRLASIYPQLVVLQLDDFMKNPTNMPSEDIAEMQSNMRSQAPWMSFVPVSYYHDPAAHPDATRTVDSVTFYFKNDKAGYCIAGACGENSIDNYLGEIDDMEATLPAGRKLQAGIYYGLYFGGQATGQEGTARYDTDLTRLALLRPDLGGVTAYHAVIVTDPKYAVLKAIYPFF